MTAQDRLEQLREKFGAAIRRTDFPATTAYSSTSRRQR